MSPSVEKILVLSKLKLSVSPFVCSIYAKAVRAIIPRSSVAEIYVSSGIECLSQTLRQRLAAVGQSGLPRRVSRNTVVVTGLIVQFCTCSKIIWFIQSEILGNLEIIVFTLIAAEATREDVSLGALALAAVCLFIVGALP